MIGTIFTFARNFLVLLFAISGFISLTTYENPQITQYTIYESRNDGKELNLGESHSEFLFGFFSFLEGAFIALDPTICTFKLQNVSLNPATGLEVHEDLELTAIS